MQRHPTFFALWIGLLAVLAQPVLAEPLSPERRADLARFSLLTGDTDRALHWTSGGESNELGLIRGRIYETMGLPQKAEGQLGPLLGSNGGQPEARLALAKSRLAQGKTSEAEALLETVRGNSNDDVGQEAAFLLAEQARRNEEYERAGQILEAMPEGKWAAMGYLNLATAYTLIDRDPARSLISLRVASAMVRNSDNDADQELRQRILLTAGYLSLENESPEKALTFLSKIVLDGFYTPQALYFHGLANSRRENHRAAMQSWHRARKYPLAFPGSAEAWLGMARGYDEAGYLGRAGDAYLAATSAFESELVTLKELIDQVTSKGGYQAMIQSAQSEDIEWFLAESKTLTQPRLAYLMQFMRDPEAQNAARRVAELEKTARDLNAHSRDLVVLANMLESRLKSVQDQQSDKRQGLAQQIEQLEQRAEAARARLENIAVSGDGTEVVTGELARQLESVKALGESGELSAEEAKRQQRLEGVLKWEAQEQLENAQRQLMRTLDSIDQSLVAARESHERFEVRLQDAPERFKALLRRVRDAQDEVDQQLRTTGQLRERSETVLDERLIAFLKTQFRQMEAHLDRSDQQLAHLYEYLALQRAKLGEEAVQ